MSSDMAIRPSNNKNKIIIVIHNETGEHILEIDRDYILTLIEGLVHFVPQEKLWDNARNIPCIINEVTIIRYVV